LPKKLRMCSYRGGLIAAGLAADRGQGRGAARGKRVGERKVGEVWSIYKNGREVK
jgi:hypothetical protein